MDNAYKTMDLPFMESVWWVFGQLYEKGLVYEGFKVMPFSARNCTAAPVGLQPARRIVVSASGSRR